MNEQNELPNDNIRDVKMLIKREFNVTHFCLGFVGFFFTLFIFLTNILFFPLYVQGLSMQPNLNASTTLENEDYVKDIVYVQTWGEIKYLDIVVFDSKDYTNDNSSYIKRVIGLPGDTISFEYEYFMDGLNQKIRYWVKINGERIKEPYIKEQMVKWAYYLPSSSAWFDFCDFVTSEKSLTLASNEYYLMGDNRNNSSDSRFLGPIKRKDILVKVALNVPYGQTLLEALINKIF